MANAASMRPIATESHDNYISKMAYDANNNLEYLGKAAIGSATSAAVWQIKKFTYDVSNNLTGILWANGNESFANIWDNYATLSYS